MEHLGADSYLFHRLTRERVLLPPPPQDAWALGADDGWCFLASGDHRRWVSSMSQRRIVKSPAGIVVLTGEEVALLGEVMNEHRQKLLPMHVGSACVILRVWYFLRRQHGGSHWWWGLSTVWHTIQPLTVTPGQWVANFWRHWVKRFKKLNIGSPDFRPSSRIQKVGTIGFPSDFVVDGRVLSEASVSTPVFLALLLRLTAWRNQGRERNRDEVDRWEAFFKAFLKQCLPKRLAFTIVLEPLGALPIEVAPHGRFPKLVEVDHVRVVVQDIGDSNVPFPAVMAQVFQNAGEADLQVLLARMEQDGCRCWPVFWQVIRGVSAAIEAKLCDDERPDFDTIVLSGAVSASKTQTMHLSRMAKALKDRMGYRHKAFDHAASYISLACDATRIGKRACMVGAVALPNNTFAWCPPQADQTGGRMGAPAQIGVGTSDAYRR